MSGTVYRQVALVLQELDAARPGLEATPTKGMLPSPRPKPPVPPKPQIDASRFSRTNLEESNDVDLDALLNELFELENQLTADNNGPPSEIFKRENGGASQNGYRVTTAVAEGHSAAKSASACCGSSLLPTTAQQHEQQQQQQQQHHHHYYTPQLPLTDGASRIAGRAMASAETQEEEDEAVRTCKVPATAEEVVFVSGPRTALITTITTTAGQRGAGAQDDQHSRDSGHASSVDSSLLAPSPTQQSMVESNTAPAPSDDSSSIQQTSSTTATTDSSTEKDTVDKEKAEKIRLAIEKMKEANIKKLYVKFFTDRTGQSSKGLLVDERSTVAYVLRQLAEKLRLPLTAEHVILETYPDLHMERIYEDHEYLVENILLWSPESPNRLAFVENGEKYLFFREPQRYLLTETSVDRHKPIESTRKAEMIEEFFAPSVVQPHELNGWLYLKVEGRKSWKKTYFVLRHSGLYYIRKGKSKSSKDLQSLQNLESVQIYTSIDWRRRYKAPTDYGIALKHPQIQVKASKYIRYLCAPDEETWRRWLIGLRIAKHGRQLLDNYEAIKTYLESAEAKSSVGATSLGSSASTENCRLSCVSSSGSEHQVVLPGVVIRPTRNSQLQENPQAGVQMRVKSSFGAGRSSGASSRGSWCSNEERCSVGRRLPSVDEDWCVGKQIDSSMSTSPASISPFDDSSVTGTIKRQPGELQRRAQFLVAEQERRRRSVDSVQSSCRDIGGGGELDSDEDTSFPAPPPELTCHVEPAASAAPPPSVAQVTSPPNRRVSKPLPPKRSDKTRLSINGPLTTLSQPTSPSSSSVSPLRIAAPTFVHHQQQRHHQQQQQEPHFQSELLQAMKLRQDKMFAVEQRQKQRNKLPPPAVPPKHFNVSNGGAISPIPPT